MKIAMIAPVAVSVPPKKYGGTELVVSLLTEALIRREHDVTLFASGDSVTSARLISICDRCCRESAGNSEKERHILEMRNVASCLVQADEFDIIHNHAPIEVLSMARLSKKPFLTTLHNPLEGEKRNLFLAYQEWLNTWYSTISWAAREELLLGQEQRFAGVIYNAIDADSYPFNEGEREGYILYLAVINPNKGTHLAIEVARRLRRRLIIAGPVCEGNEEYFRTMIEPEIDGDLIQYFGEANYRQKRELLAKADCLLAPITWAEPFGLYFVEAMACGAPVVTFDRGAAREVVSHNETGYVVKTIEEMVAAVNNVPRIDRRFCRQHVEETFNVERMVDGYLRAYEYILKRS